MCSPSGLCATLAAMANARDVISIYLLAELCSARFWQKVWVLPSTLLPGLPTAGFGRGYLENWILTNWILLVILGRWDLGGSICWTNNVSSAMSTISFGVIPDVLFKFEVQAHTIYNDMGKVPIQALLRTEEEGGG